MSIEVNIMAAKKRRPVILMLYKILFIAAFAVWVIFAFKHLFPLPLSAFVYDFSPPIPVLYESYDNYLEHIKKFEESHDAYIEMLKRDGFEGLRFFPHSIKITLIDYDAVNESDAIKNDGKYFYIFSDCPSIKLDDYPHTLFDGSVIIADAYSADEMDVVSKILLASGKTGVNEKKYTDMYISGQNLVVLSYEYDLVEYDFSYGYSPDFHSTVTIVDIYDITDKNKPVRKRTFELDGNLSGSREQNGVLYLFTTKSIRWNSGYYIDYTDAPGTTDRDKYIPSYFDSVYGEKQYVPAERLYSFLPKKIGPEISILISTINIAAIDLNSNAPADVSSYIFMDFCIPTLYMGAENIYLMDNDRRSVINYTNVTKLGVEKTNIRYVASIKLPGLMRGRFSADEYKGNLRIATTEGDNRDYLFVLDENLNFLSAVRNIANGKRTMSVGFDKEMVYVYTFDPIDTLFTVDLSDPQSPEIKAELEKPG